MARAVYIHIPFCTHICLYCDFNKVFIKGQPVEAYLDALDQEMVLTLGNAHPQPVDTIYIGGGTPTALSPRQLDRLLQTIGTYFQLDPGGEWTVEANPGDLDREKLSVMKAHGVNRLSLGVQSFQERLLKMIGRSHLPEDVYRSLELAREMDFRNINIDLMFRLPTQTISEVESSLSELISLGVEHASVYSLIVEPRTVFYQLMKKGKLPLPDEDEEADMFARVIDRLEGAGYIHYEISNFAKPGFESRHNLTYWNNEPYYGFGAGAHSFDGIRRRVNIGPVNHYIRALKQGRLPIREEIGLSLRERMEEEMFLGMRKMEGVRFEHFREKYGRDLREIWEKEVQDLVARGLLLEDEGGIRLSRRGIFLGNLVFEAFLKE